MKSQRAPSNLGTTGSVMCTSLRVDKIRQSVVLVVVLVSLFALFSMPAPVSGLELEVHQDALQPNVQGSALSVIKQIVDAKGGFDTLKRHDRMVRRDRGTVRWSQSDVNSLPVDYLYLPEDRSITTYQYPDGERRLVQSGSESWYSACGLRYRYSKSEIAAQQYYIRHSARHALTCSDYTGAELRPQSSLNGTTCDVIVLQMSGTSPLEIWADAQSHMVLQCKYEALPSDPTVKADNVETIRFGDYTVVDGEMIARSIEDGSTHVAISDINFQDTLSASQIEMLRFPEPDVKSAVIPFKIFHGHIITYGKINGAPVLFDVDTGAANSSMDTLVANFGHVPKGPPNGGSIGLFSHNPKGYSGLVKTLSVGKYSFKNVPVSISKENYSRRTVALGIDFLRQYCVTLNFKDQKLLLERSAPELIQRDAVIIPFKLYRSIYLEGQIGNESKQMFLFDTGVDDAIWMKDEPKYLVTQSTTKAMDSHYVIRHVRRGQVLTASVADKITLVNPTVYLITPGSPFKKSIFGLKILDDFQSCTLDFDNERMICIPWGPGGRPKEPKTENATAE